MDFEVVGAITDIETIAVKRIRILPQLRKQYGKGPLEKTKGNSEGATA